MLEEGETILAITEEIGAQFIRDGGKGPKEFLASLAPALVEKNLYMEKKLALVEKVVNRM